MYVHGLTLSFQFILAFLSIALLFAITFGLL